MAACLLIIYPKGEFYPHEILQIGLGSIISLSPLFIYILISKWLRFEALISIVAGHVILFFFLATQISVILFSNVEPKILALLDSHRYDTFFNLIICIVSICISIGMKMRARRTDRS